MRILDRVNNSKRGPVPDSRVRMSQIRLYPQNLLSLLIVDWYPVAGDVLGVPQAFQPANILPDQVIVLKRRLFQPRISIIKPQEKASLVHPRIVVGEDYRPDRTQMQDKVRVRREPRHNHSVLVRVRQGRQRLGPGLTLRRYCPSGHSLDAAQLDSISYL